MPGWIPSVTLDSGTHVVALEHIKDEGANVQAGVLGKIDGEDHIKWDTGIQGEVLLGEKRRSNCTHNGQNFTASAI